MVLAGNHPHEKNHPCYTLEVYDVMHAFFPVDITEDVVELVAKTNSWSSGPGGT